MSGIFATVLTFNAMIFAFVVMGAENPVAFGFMVIASPFLTMTGFTALKYAERTQLLSQSLTKELEVRVYSQVRQVGSDGANSKCNSQAGGRFRRSFRKQCLVIHMEPFGAVKSGHAVTWIQQIIENTVTAIFMVILGENRIFF